MPGPLDHMHLGPVVTCLGQLLDRSMSSINVHPVVVAVQERDGNLQLTYAIDDRYPCVGTRCEDVR